MRLFILSFIIALTLPLFTQAQERITGLFENQKVKAETHKAFLKKQTAQALTLPFFDDFSNTTSVFPDSRHWTDNYVYINSDYPVNPPTVGVATFDAIDNTGKLYSHGSPFQFGADTLTSVDIRLDSIFSGNPRRITRADSLYLSFYYQPQGNGNVPAARDSLILEFLAPDEDLVIIIPADTVLTGTDTVFIPADTSIYRNWVRVWGSGGSDLASFHAQGNEWFKQVLIPILDSARFYKPDFKFRFRNIASLADAILPDWQSNGDQWNIDYIYLNTDRSRRDIYHPDVAFVDKAPKILQRYTTMPYDHYRSNFVNEMAKNLSIKIANLDSISYNATYRYEVRNNANNVIHTYSGGGNYFVPPYLTQGYVTHPPFANPPVGFIFPLSSTEPVVFTVTHILDAQAPMGRNNDTIRYRQSFNNFFAYDDGTAEVGYGITPTGAEAAYKFQLNRNDSLYGVYMYFNQTLTQGNVHSFYLKVWNESFGKPNEEVYSRFGYTPVFEDSLNKYSYYKLDKPIYIEPGKFPNRVFFVGWEQASSYVLNMGFDRNNDASQYLFYRTNNEWNNSLFRGALMMRPVVGREAPVSLDEKINRSGITLYPNPVNTGIVRIKADIPVSDMSSYSVLITTPDGRVVNETPYKTELDVSYLAKGFYLVVLKYKGSTIGVEKMIINH